jgi:multimeric flavodoxin WrbA
MKIIAIVGSHRKNGNTARATALFERALREIAGEGGVPLSMETVYLGELRMESCRGCRTCFDRGEEKCPLHDDLLSLRNRIAEADGALLASPVYVNDVSGSMKTMIDRLAFVCHRPAFQRIPACLLATTGSSPTRHTLRTLQGAWLSMGGPIAGAAGVKAGALSSRDEIKAGHGRRIDELAVRLFSAVQKRRYEKPGFASLFIFCIQQKARRRIWGKSGDDTVDFRYWRDRGWFERRCTFYIPHRAPLPRVAAARILGSIFARIFA